MVNRSNNATFIAQKQFNDFTAWRSVPNRIRTSSQLFDVTRRALEERELENRQVVEFDNNNVSEFYRGVKDTIDNITSLFDGEITTNNLNNVRRELFDLQPTLDIFEQSIISSRSQLDPGTYDSSISRFRELQRITFEERNSSSQDISRVTNAVFEQIERIEGLNGASGRKVVGNILNNFLSNTKSSDTSRLGVLESIASEFFSNGILGQELLSQAEPIISASQGLLEQAFENFNTNTMDSRTSLSSTLSPIFETLNTITRFLPSNINSELESITRQVSGLTSNIDRGLSAVKSDGGQLQPVSGQFGVLSNVRISAQTFKIPKEFDPSFNGLNSNTSFVGQGQLGGVNSQFPSVFIQTVNENSRFNTSNIGIVSDKSTIVVPELDDIRFQMLDTFRKMPGEALSNPELANGISLTTPIIEPVVGSIIGNSRSGTTVADLVGTVQTNEQVFVPRLG